MKTIIYRLAIVVVAIGMLMSLMKFCLNIENQQHLVLRIAEVISFGIILLAFIFDPKGLNETLIKFY
jgi:phosphoglycerol transferase MdoB-like AlkP superfamily enzyme